MSQDAAEAALMAQAQMRQNAGLYMDYSEPEVHWDIHVPITAGPYTCAGVIQCSSPAR